MNKYLKQLVELANLDKQIDDFEPKIEKINKDLNLKKNELDKIEIDIENLSKELEDLKSQKAQTNAHISEFGTKIKNISKKSASIKTEREAKALNLEEDITKEQLAAANEEIARLEKIMDSKNELLKELMDKKKSLDGEYKEIELSVQDEIQTINSQRDDIFKIKNQLINSMNQKIISFYEKIRKWAGNTVVVPVKKQACYGCFMHINDKIYTQVLKSEDIVTCPHCGRIIYKEIIVTQEQEQDIKESKKSKKVIKKSEK